ncbi:MAG: hypothetical protein LQ342_000318 [Letrouitia transgressa]|nr:MAG: hypothetical protein LQ342_000318 [Letrouitia transgressa]
MAETVEAKPPSGDITYGEGEANAEASLDSGAEIAEADDAAQEQAAEKLRREREARAQALTLEIVGDLPFAEKVRLQFACIVSAYGVDCPADEDLDLIFSRFGKIISCEVIRDKRTGDSLQYAFIEFENQKDCEQAYFKMQGVLIDDHRIHVDFSQSVSKLSDTWRTATNSKRAKQGGGFGGVANLEKRRQYRAEANTKSQRSSKYDMMLDKDDIRRSAQGPLVGRSTSKYRSRSRSPRRSYSQRDRHPSRRDEEHRREQMSHHRREESTYNRRR